MSLFTKYNKLDLKLRRTKFRIIFVGRVIRAFTSACLTGRDLGRKRCFVKSVGRLGAYLRGCESALGGPSEPVALMYKNPPYRNFSVTGEREVVSSPEGRLCGTCLRFLSRVEPRFFVVRGMGKVTGGFSRVVTGFGRCLKSRCLCSCQLLGIRSFNVPRGERHFVVVNGEVNITPGSVFTRVRHCGESPFLLESMLFKLPRLRTEGTGGRKRCRSRRYKFARQSFSCPSASFCRFVGNSEVVAGLCGRGGECGGLHSVRVCEELPRKTGSLRRSVRSVVPCGEHGGVFGSGCFGLSRGRVYGAVASRVGCSYGVCVRP